VDWSNFISALIGALSGGSFAGILVKMYLDHKLKIERQELAEERLHRQNQREASVAVAEILGEWVRSTYSGGSMTNEQRWHLQVTYWKNILLLDKQLIDLLFPLLANARGSIGSNEMIVQARKVLLGLDKPDIKGTDLNNWLPVGPTMT